MKESQRTELLDKLEDLKSCFVCGGLGTEHRSFDASGFPLGPIKCIECEGTGIQPNTKGKLV